MPLNISALQNGIQTVSQSPAPDIAGCAQQWASAATQYATAVVPPSLTVSAAGSALTAALAGAFATPLAAPGMESAFAAFAASVGVGMAPAFVAAPPPRPVGFATQFALPPPPTAAAAASAVTTLIDTWMRSATATPAVGGSPVPWV